jgi:hypothetical protein
MKTLLSKIDRLEENIKKLHEVVADPNFYQSSNKTSEATLQQLTALEKELADAYITWERYESGEN